MIMKGKQKKINRFGGYKVLNRVKPNNKKQKKEDLQNTVLHCFRNICILLWYSSNPFLYVEVECSANIHVAR